MATTRFYAAGADEIRLMEYVFAETGCEVWESYSTYDTPLRRFTSVEHLERDAELGRTDRAAPSLALCLWSPRMGGGLVASRIDLKVRDATFRERADGWGLVHLHFAGLDATTVRASHISANSLRRAEAWSHTNTALPPPSVWEWREVEGVTRRLGYHVRKRLAITTKDGAAVLPEAHAVATDGGRLNSRE